MKKTMLSFTLVIFSWCPKGGVGARRWAKFSKYLSREAAHISVITSAYPYKDKINWCQDVENLANLKTTFVPLRYPAFLLQKKRTFLVKLGSRLLKQTTHPVDASEKWAQGVAREIIKRATTQAPIVLTLPPFSLLTIVPTLRKAVPKRPVILDYRDPWQHSIDKKKYPVGYLEVEKIALDLSQEVWVTTEEHKRAIQDIYGILSSKIFVLHNGFDLEDYRKIEVLPGDLGKAIYLGQMMEQRVFHLLDILKILDQSDLTELKRIFQITAYTDSTIPTHKFSSEQLALFKKYVELKAPVPAHEVPGILKHFRYGITLGVAGYDLTIPVKNFEYLALGKQILSFGPVTSFHEELRQGGHLVSKFNPNDVLNLFQNLHLQLGQGFESRPPSNYDIANISQLVSARLAYWQHESSTPS